MMTTVENMPAVNSDALELNRKFNKNFRKFMANVSAISFKENQQNQDIVGAFVHAIKHQV